MFSAVELPPLYSLKIILFQVIKKLSLKFFLKETTLVYDMAKFNDYTIGKHHTDEYGNPDVEEDFIAMMQYSPYHNIKEDVNYPITLIITSENDDRVPPIHSYKFAAKLQNRTVQKNPIYLKVQRNSGHYGKISTYNDYIEEKADFYNFLLFHLNQ